MPSYEWTQVAYWKHPHLSYTVFIALTILGGVIGLDHLYLRSPATAFLKMASFFVLPFFWYIYDILQSTAEKSLLMKYGLTTPFITTSGIGAGMFKDPNEPVKEPLPEDQTPPSPVWFIGFFFLSLLPFGLDHFIVGDKNGGLAKILIMLIPILGFIYASVWSMYSMYRVFFSTETLFSHGISRFFTPKMDEYFFAVDRLGMAAAKPSEPKKMSFMDLLKTIWGNIKKFFTGGDDEKEKDVETHGLLAAVVQQGKEFVNQQKDKILAKSPMAQKIVAGVEMANEVAQGAIGSTVKAAVSTAGQVGELVTSAPGEAAKAVELVSSGVNDKLRLLPSPVEMAKRKAESLVPSLNRNQSGGGIVSDNSTAVFALVAMFAIVASFSLGKYMFVKFHEPQEQKAHSERPPTRNEFVDQRGDLSDMPPAASTVEVQPATSVSSVATA
jgi:hypothetical protein